MDGPANSDWLIRLRILVRFGDCDGMGHVNNAVYSTYLEQARIVLWRKQAGFELRKAAMSGGRKGEGFILARTEIDFRSQAHDGEELEVRLGLEKFGRTSVTYRYEIAKVSNDQLVACARTVQVWYDYETSQPVPLSDATRAWLVQPVAGTQAG